MHDGVLLGVARRRCWTDQVKLAILGEVGVNGWTVQDVAQRHDVRRQQIYQWRREMRSKGLWSIAQAPVFLPVEVARAAAGAATTEPESSAIEIIVMLRNGRQLRCAEGIGEAALELCAYSGVSAHPFRSHSATCSDTFGHL